MTRERLTTLALLAAVIATWAAVLYVVTTDAFGPVDPVEHVLDTRCGEAPR